MPRNKLCDALVSATDPNGFDFQEILMRKVVITSRTRFMQTNLKEHLVTEVDGLNAWTAFEETMRLDFRSFNTRFWIMILKIILALTKRNIVCILRINHKFLVQDTNQDAELKSIRHRIGTYHHFLNQPTTVLASATDELSLLPNSSVADVTRWNASASKFKV